MWSWDPDKKLSSLVNKTEIHSFILVCTTFIFSFIYWCIYIYAYIIYSILNMHTYSYLISLNINNKNSSLNDFPIFLNKEHFLILRNSSITFSKVLMIYNSCTVHAIFIANIRQNIFGWTTSWKHAHFIFTCGMLVW